MRYFKINAWIYELTDDLTKYHLIYNLEIKKHFKDPWWSTHPDYWKNLIELTKNDLFIELL